MAVRGAAARVVADVGLTPTHVSRLVSVLPAVPSPPLSAHPIKSRRPWPIFGASLLRCCLLLLVFLPPPFFRSHPSHYCYQQPPPSPPSPARPRSPRAMDAVQSVAGPLHEFSIDSARLLRRCTKPDRRGTIAM